MTFAPKTATALALALALAACGDSDNGANETAAPETQATVTTTGSAATPGDAATPAPGETPTPGATPSAAPSASATPTPAPTASASRPAAAATTAAATPPQAFAICSACHSVAPGENGIGPSLANVYGARAGHVGSFDYSEAMEKSGLTWNQGTLDRYLTDPMGVVPGTKMAYPGLKDAAKRRAMIDYLKTL